MFTSSLIGTAVSGRKVIKPTIPRKFTAYLWRKQAIRYKPRFIPSCENSVLEKLPSGFSQPAANAGGVRNAPVIRGAVFR